GLSRRLYPAGGHRRGRPGGLRGPGAGAGGALPVSAGHRPDRAPGGPVGRGRNRQPAGAGPGAAAGGPCGRGPVGRGGGAVSHRGAGREGRPMALIRLQATFGCLDEAVLEPGPGLTVLTLPNGAGKSTWLAFLTAMFYGIDRAERKVRDREPVRTR